MNKDKSNNVIFAGISGIPDCKCTSVYQVDKQPDYNKNIVETFVIRWYTRVTAHELHNSMENLK